MTCRAAPRSTAPERCQVQRRRFRVQRLRLQGVPRCWTLELHIGAPSRTIAVPLDPHASPKSETRRRAVSSAFKPRFAVAGPHAAENTAAAHRAALRVRRATEAPRSLAYSGCSTFIGGGASASDRWKLTSLYSRAGGACFHSLDTGVITSSTGVPDGGGVTVRSRWSMNGLTPVLPSVGSRSSDHPVVGQMR